MFSPIVGFLVRCSHHKYAEVLILSISTFMALVMRFWMANERWSFQSAQAQMVRGFTVRKRQFTRFANIDNKQIS